jgi:signal transduction histidine kinase/CheY-like chemotaxis protein
MCTQMKWLQAGWANLHLRGKGLVVVAIPLIALFAASWFLYQAQGDVARTQSATRRIFAVRDQVRTVETLLLDAETGIHGFGLTGRRSFLKPFNEAFARLPKALNNLVDLVGGNASQQARATRVRFLAGNKLEVMAELRGAYLEESAVSPARRQRLFRQSNRVMEELRTEIAAMRAGAERRLDIRLAEVEAARQQQVVATGAVIALGLIGGLVVALLFATGIVRRVERLQDNAGRLAGEQPLVSLPPGEDEIGRLGRALEAAAALLAEREQKMSEAKEEAEKANRAKSDFLSRTSHELRTPLNSVLGFAQLLEMGDLGAQERQSVTQITNAGRHLLDLINDVLDIARIEAGGMSIAPDAIRVQEVVTEAVDLIRPLAQQQGVEVDTDLEEVSDRFVIADKQRLNQILLNLLSNAIKYNHPGGQMKITCSVSELDRIRFEVADSGRGMNAQQLERLFTPFDRLGAERFDVQGAGIGLALSNLLAGLMNSEIEVESQPGRGSTFWFDLPASGSADASEQRIGTRDPSEVVSVPETFTILYIEDNRSNLELVEQVLTRRPGVRLLAATSGGLGLELARKYDPDIVLLDLHLPDVKGLDVLRDLKQNPATRGLHVIALSADASPTMTRRAHEAGADEYLTKPLDVRRFLELIDESLSLSR